MGGLSAAFLAMGVMSAGQKYTAGQAASSEAKYNAKVKEAQAEMITKSQEFEAMQWDREINRVSATTRANIGFAGLQFTGSPLTVLIDTQSQMKMDKAIGYYNQEVNKFFTMSEARMYESKAKTARQAGYSGAFTQLLSTGLDYSLRSGWAKTYSGTPKLGGTFDVPSPYSSTKVGRSMYSFNR